MEDFSTSFKALFFVEVHLDKMKNLMVHSSQILQPISIGLIVGRFSINGLFLWTSGVKQA